MNKAIYQSHLVAICFLFSSTLLAKDCNVRDYGGLPDDNIKDTVAIQVALDACSKRGPGGGRVVIPEGTWISGQIRLRSDTDLHIARGAILLGSPDIADYPKAHGAAGIDHGDEALKRDGLIVADGVERVALTGSGIVDGNGESFWDVGFLNSGKARPSLPRPMPWIAIRNARDVRVRDLTFRNSPSYGVNITESSLVRIQDIRIENHPKSPNTDGIQIVDSQNVLISGAFINTGDDAIVLKSHRLPIEDIVIRDCMLISDDAAFKLGTGSEKPIRRVTIADTSIRDSRMGIALFMKDGGIFEGLLVRNVSFTGKRTRHTTEYPIYIDIDQRTEKSSIGFIRDIRIEGFRAETRGNVLIQGHPKSPIQDLLLRDIELNIGEDAVKLADIRGKPKGNALVGVLPESVDYGRQNAHITLAHARDVQFSGVRVYAKPDIRKNLFTVDVEGAETIEVLMRDSSLLPANEKTNSAVNSTEKKAP
jgi:Glycosyl hydrolases family 28